MNKIQHIAALSAYISARDVLMLVRKGSNLIIAKGSTSELARNKLHKVGSFNAKRGVILGEYKSHIYVNIDGKLLRSNDFDSWDMLLQTSTPGNYFWHMVTSKLYAYVHEYGVNTRIYRSKDGRTWKSIVAVGDIDRFAKHFHSIAYDPYRNMLLATLGDSNYVRVAASYDDGELWQPLYRGCWQLLPIVVLKDKIVFGMDSAIAKGGLVVWYPNESRHEVLHLKWRENEVRFVQMVDLRLLSNGMWVSALGTPQAIIASQDLKNWHPVYVEGVDSAFHHSLAISEGKDVVAFTTGKSIVLLKKDKIAKRIIETEPIVCGHPAILEKLIGLGFVLKRKIFYP